MRLEQWSKKLSQTSQHYSERSKKMADTFKGIITADGKKRQLPYNAVVETPVSDETLSIQGAFADSKVVGDKFKKVKTETDSLKEDLVANSNELYNKEEREIAVEPSEYNLLENKVAYIDTNNEIMTYENAHAYVMHKNVISGEKYRIMSQTHGSVNTLLYAICDSNGKVINSAKWVFRQILISQLI